MRFKERDLSFKLEDTTVNDRFIHEHSGIVDEETGGKVITPIHNQVVFREDFFNVIGSQAKIIRCDVDIWVQ